MSMIYESTDQIACGLGECDSEKRYGASIFEELLNEDEEFSLFEEVDQKIEQMKENLTIPQNKDDKVESELYKKLENNYDHADRIVRWYRNEKKNGTEENELKTTFIDNLENIKDLFKTYEQYIDSLKKMKMLNKKVELNGKQFDVVKDIDKIRRLSGFRSLVKSMGDIVHSDTSIETTNQKYAISDEDRNKIRLIGFTENVMCWCTEGYETTNRFIYHLWQNAKTLGRGDVYGDKSEQSPYCTHSKEHWDDYSKNINRYQQYWYLERFDNRMNVSYDIMLARNRNGVESQDEIKAKDEEFKAKIKDLKFRIGDLNNKDVISVFNMMKGFGPSLIIAMNDTNDDFLDSKDEKFDDFKDLNHGNEVEQLNNGLFEKVSKYHKVKLGEKEFNLEAFEQELRVKGERYDGEKFTGRFEPSTFSESDDIGTTEDLTTLEGLPKNMCGSIQIEDAPNLKSLKGMPKTFEGSIYISNVPIHNLEGFPQEIKQFSDPNGSTLKTVSIHRTHVKNLKGLENLPTNFNLKMSGNDIENLEGCPKKIHILDLSNNQKLKTLKGIGDYVDQLTLTGCDALESLDYAPICDRFYFMYPQIETNITKPIVEEYKNWLDNVKYENESDDVKTKDDVDKVEIWKKIHTSSDGKHYIQRGPTLREASNMSVEELNDVLKQSGHIDFNSDSEQLDESNDNIEFDSLVNEVEDEIDDMKDYERFESLLETDVSDYDVPFSDISIDDDSIRNSDCSLNAYSVQVPTDNDSMAYNPKTNPDKAIDVVLNMPNAKVEIFLDTDSREWDSWINGNEGKLSPEQMEKFFNTDFYKRICDKLNSTWPNEDETFGRLLEATKIKKYKTDGYAVKEEIDEETDVFSRLNKDKDKSREKNASGDQIRTRSGRKIISPSDFLVTHDDNEAYAVWPEKGKEFKWSQWADWEKIHIFARIRFKMGQYVYGGSLTPFVEDDENRGFKFYNLDLEPKLQYLTPQESDEIMKLTIVQKFTKHAIKHIQKYITIPDEELFKRIGRPEKCTLDGIRKTKQIMKNTMKALRENRADTFIYT